jgi:hypothetical protein
MIRWWHLMILSLIIAAPFPYITPFGEDFLLWTENVGPWVEYTVLCTLICSLIFGLAVFAFRLKGLWLVVPIILAFSPLLVQSYQCGHKARVCVP